MSKLNFDVIFVIPAEIQDWKDDPGLREMLSTPEGMLCLVYAMDSNNIVWYFDHEGRKSVQYCRRDKSGQWQFSRGVGWKNDRNIPMLDKVYAFRQEIIYGHYVN